MLSRIGEQNGPTERMVPGFQDFVLMCKERDA